uniref:AlNc14C23G2336 protein n=1 Tax=Albugo laibachii Nc14 TaxID=890382 RepID=F0W632_9STRA|nr:AlNc14C23G2336 [Albugo laibachii Nc14]|eukprot:CCA16574.1 AlNc14C23G2336 [Albugo laibachii Nc14]
MNGLRLFQESLKKPKRCFKTIKSADTKSRCLTRVAKQQDAVTLSMGAPLDYYEQQSKSQEALAPGYIHYIFTNTEVEWKKVTDKCKAPCGEDVKATEERNCLTPINNHFDPSMQYQAMEKRMEDNDPKMGVISSDLSGICMWVLHRDRHKCQACINAKQSQIIVSLSRVTALMLSSHSRVLECMDEAFGGLIFKELPNNICSYANRNVSSPTLTNNVILIHLESNDEINLFKCVTCLCLYEEVLVISVDQTYLWLTKKDKDSVSGLAKCSEECSLDKKYTFTEDRFDNFYSLKPLSTDDVISVFCGENKQKKYVGKINRATRNGHGAKSMNYNNCLRKLESYSFNRPTSLGTPLQTTHEVTNQPIAVEFRKRKPQVTQPGLRNATAKKLMDVWSCLSVKPGAGHGFRVSLLI